MTVNITYDEEMDKKVLEAAKEDGHNSRSALIRKAIAFYLSQKSQKVADEK